MPLDKSSLVLLDYTARVKDTNEIFETTREDEAKKTDHYDPTRKYEPRLVSVGESWVLKGLDEALSKANVGDKMNVEVAPDKGFGDRDPGKVRMIPQRKLGDKADEVSVGDVIEVDDRTGIVRYVGSGRIQVDFNHRFAGRTLLYDVNVLKKLDNDEEKVKALVGMIESAVANAYGLDDRLEESVRRLLAASLAPEGRDRFVLPATSVESKSALGVVRAGAVLGSEDSELRIWVTGGADEGELHRLPERMPGWLAIEGAVFDVVGSDVESARYLFHRASHLTDPELFGVNERPARNRSTARSRKRSIRT